MAHRITQSPNNLALEGGKQMPTINEGEEDMDKQGCEDEVRDRNMEEIDKEVEKIQMELLGEELVEQGEGRHRCNDYHLNTLLLAPYKCMQQL